MKIALKNNPLLYETRFANRVTPEFDREFRAVAARERKLFSELLEDMLALYNEHHGIAFTEDGDIAA